MPWLVDRAAAAGVSIELKDIHSLEQIGLTDFVDIETPGWPVDIFPRQRDIVLTAATH